jgi:hypothetical protein
MLNHLKFILKNWSSIKNAVTRNSSLKDVWFEAFKELVEQKNVVFNSFHSRFKLAHSSYKELNLHTNS